MGKPTIWFPNRSARSLKYPCSENKGADQLRSYCEADLRLFRLCRLLVFPCGGSIIKRLIRVACLHFEKHCRKNGLTTRQIYIKCETCMSFLFSTRLGASIFSDALQTKVAMIVSMQLY